MPDLSASSGTKVGLPMLVNYNVSESMAPRAAWFAFATRNMSTVETS